VARRSRNPHVHGFDGMQSDRAWNDPHPGAMMPTTEQNNERRRAECLAAGKQSKECLFSSKDRDVLKGPDAIDPAKDFVAHGVVARGLSAHRPVRLGGGRSTVIAGEMQAMRAHRSNARGASFRPPHAIDLFQKGPSAALLEASYAPHSINRPVTRVSDPVATVKGTELDRIRAGQT